MAFLGDSAMNQLFEAIMFALYDAGVPLTWVSRSGSEDQRPELYERDAACSLRQKRPAKGGSELHLSLRHGQPCEPSHYTRRAAHWEACAHLPASELWIGAPPAGSARDTRTVLRHWRVDKADGGPAACPNASFFAARVDAAARGADVLFANVGLHYNSRHAKALGLADYQQALTITIITINTIITTW